MVHLGLEHYQAGPQSRSPANDLAASLAALGFSLRRLKTGTPARVRGRSLRFAEMERQPGEELERGFSFWSALPRQEQKDSWLTYTQPATHDLIRAHLDETALFSGAIKGVGPRYCPSIEAKLVQFPGRERHQVFVEPESAETDEWYLAGLSTSLPPSVQTEILRTIPGLGQVEIVRPGYAIEYDADRRHGSPAFPGKPGSAGALFRRTDQRDLGLRGSRRPGSAGGDQRSPVPTRGNRR